MKKLTKIRLINWHYIYNETIEVRNNVLLTGANATGKSTILDAILFVITAGDTAFNLAANEKGKRDLKGYIKCKLGIDEKEYLRDGDVSSHIALEFFDESLETYTTVGAILDAFGDLSPVKVLFYETSQEINDEWFIEDNGLISGTVDFRKKNDEFSYYLTKKEAKRAFKSAFGAINDDFFRLIPKALAFKPISDVKEFIYQNILEEKQIDVSAIQDSIRSYKELENTLNVIKVKIADLKAMESIHAEIKNIENTKNYYQYLMKLFDNEKFIEDNKNALRQIEVLETKKVLRAGDFKKIDLEIESLNERAKEIYLLLSNNEEYKASEYIEKQINKCRQNISELAETQEIHVKKIAQIKEQINALRKINNRKVYNELANLALANVDDLNIEKTKLDLISIDTKLKETIALCNQSLGKLNIEKETVIKEINEIRQALEGLNENKLRYNPSLLAIRNDIASGLKRLYAIDISVHIFSELIEITDPAWADTVEIYLGNRRFDLIVEPRYFDAALQIFARVKNNYRLYGVGLVNTKQISTYNSYEKRSLASILTSDNIDARRYINMTCGNVIMCDSETDLEKYQTSVTNTGLSYSRFTVRSMNPNIEKPFIGKNALGQQTENWNTLAIKQKEKYLLINEEMNTIEQELNILTYLDIKSVLASLDSASALYKEESLLEDLIAQGKRQKNMTTIELEDDYNKIALTIKSCDLRKMAISQEIGGIDNAINNYKEQIELFNSELAKSNLELEKLIDGNYEIESKAKREYEEIKESIGVSKALVDYQKRFASEESNYQLAVDGLINRQFKYINTYNSAFSIGVLEMSKYLGELNKLEKAELIKYEQKVRSAREEAEIVFKEDFLSKLRNNIMTAEAEIAKINETLKSIQFGNDRYEFVFPKSKDFSVFYEMVTTDYYHNNQSIFTFDFQSKYQQQLEELFANLAIDELNSKGAINKFTDYRTYMDYDIKITNQLGETMSYSKVFKEKSGGETQVPFYVAIIASFVRIYTKSKLMAGDPIGLVLFDEVFDKMDANRMRAMMSFITSMPLQVIIACPPQRMGLLSNYTDTTLVMVRKNTKAQVLPFVKNADDELYLEEEGEE